MQIRLGLFEKEARGRLVETCRHRFCQIAFDRRSELKPSLPGRQNPWFRPHRFGSRLAQPPASAMRGFDSSRASRGDRAPVQHFFPIPIGTTNWNNCLLPLQVGSSDVYYSIACFWHEECFDSTLRRKAGLGRSSQGPVSSLVSSAVSLRHLQQHWGYWRICKPT